MAFKDVLNNITQNKKIVNQSNPEFDRWRQLLVEKKWTSIDAYGTLTAEGLVEAIRREPYLDWPTNPSTLAHVITSVCNNIDDVLKVLNAGAYSSSWPSNIAYKTEFLLSTFYQVCKYKNIVTDSNALLKFSNLKINAYNDNSQTITYFKLLHKFNADGDIKLTKVIIDWLAEINQQKYVYAFSSSTDEQKPLYLDAILKSKDREGLMYAAAEGFIDSTMLFEALTKWNINWKQRDFLDDLAECVMTIKEPKIANSEICNNLKSEVEKTFKSMADHDLYSYTYLLESILKYVGVELNSDIKQKLMANKVFMRPDYTNKIICAKENLQNWLELEFNYDTKMYGACEHFGEDKLVEILKTSPWLGDAVVKSKLKIADDALIRYAGCMPGGDENWYIIMEELFSRIQKNKINCRSTIIKLKKSGMKTYAPVPRELNDLDAFIYAISGDNSKTLRTASDAVGVRSTSDTYRQMAFDYLKEKGGLLVKTDNNLPELSITMV